MTGLIAFSGTILADRFRSGWEMVQVTSLRPPPLLRRALVPRWQEADHAGAIDGAPMTIWDLLTSICFFVPIVGALASAKLAKVGLGGYVIAVAIGVALGLLCAWTMRSVAEAIVATLQRRPSWGHSESILEWFFRGLYLAAMVWIVFVGFLGRWISFAMLRLIF